MGRGGALIRWHGRSVDRGGCCGTSASLAAPEGGGPGGGGPGGGASRHPFPLGRFGQIVFAKRFDSTCRKSRECQPGSEGARKRSGRLLTIAAALPTGCL